MQFSRFLSLLAFSTTSTFANPVYVDPNDQSGATLFSDLPDLDLSEDSTNQAPLEVASSFQVCHHNSSRWNHDPKDVPLQELSKQSVNLAQKSADDFLNIPSANPFSANSPLVPPPGQQPATPTSPDGVDISMQSLSGPGRPASTFNNIFPLKPTDGPDCKGWNRLCCFGDLFFDDQGLLSVDQCYPCNDSSRFSFILFIPPPPPGLSTELETQLP